MKFCQNFPESHRVIWWTLEAPKYRGVRKTKDYLMLKVNSCSWVGWRENKSRWMQNNLSKKIEKSHVFAPENSILGAKKSNLPIFLHKFSGAHEVLFLRQPT